MMTAYLLDKLDLQSSSLAHEQDAASPATKIARSTLYSVPSPSSDDAIPGMITCPSVMSSQSDDDWLDMSMRSTSSAASVRPVSSLHAMPRSIFHNYWSSPSHKNSLEKGDENDGSERSQLTTDENDRDAAAKDIHASIAPSIEQKARAEDAVIAAATTSPSRNPRRRILPTPPPATAISSSLIMPRQQQPFTPLPSYDPSRKWNSTPALRKDGPHPISCLRKARYSSSAIANSSTGAAPSRVTSRRPSFTTSRLHHSMRNSGSIDLRNHDPTALAFPRLGTIEPTRRLRSVSDVTGLKKSVSFFSQVSVIEFSVPVEVGRRHKDWSKYFA